MSTQDLKNAIHFLRRVIVTGPDVDVLVRTIEALETELEHRKHRQ